MGTAKDDIHYKSLFPYFADFVRHVRHFCSHI
jgi:hypothetical protein